jgi:hypothetical protein
MLRRIGESAKSRFLRGPGIACTIAVQFLLEKQEGPSGLPVGFQASLHHESRDGIGVIVKIFRRLPDGEQPRTRGVIIEWAIAFEVAHKC